MIHNSKKTALDLLEIETEIRSYTKATRKYYKTQTKLFLDFLDKHHLDVSVQDIKAYVAHELKKGNSPSSINTKLRIIKFFIKDVLKVRNCPKIQTEEALREITALKEPQHVVDALTEQEIKNLLQVIEYKSHRLIAMLMFGSGLRVEEACKFQKEWLNTKVVVGGKGKKDRRIIISPKFLEELKPYLKWLSKKWPKSVYLFPTRGDGTQEGDHIKPWTIQKHFKEYASQAGIERRITPHILRKSFATFLKNDDVPVEDIQELLGHSDVRTTKRYIKSDPSRLDHLESPLK